MENENSRIRLQGTIVFLKANEGSKSEALVPFLYQGRDVPLQKVMRRNDNPFENNGLLAYDGKAVEVLGRRKRNGTFVVELIEEAAMAMAEPPKAESHDSKVDDKSYNNK